MILTPMESWCWYFARERGLVNGSATFRSICVLQISMSPSFTWSRMELKRLLMCLVLLWNLDSFARIACTSCLPSNLAVVGSLPAQYLGRGPGPLYIGLATTIARGSDGERPEHIWSDPHPHTTHQAQEHLSSGGYSSPCTVHPQPKKQTTTITLE